MLKNQRPPTSSPEQFERLRRAGELPAAPQMHTVARANAVEGVSGGFNGQV